MFWLKRYKKLIFNLGLLILFSLPVILPLFRSGFFITDDGEWMIIRFSAFHQALVDGQFPVRFLDRLNHGYGYPVANFLYPGFMYLAEIPKILGFGFVDSIKIILGLSLVFSAVFTYLWLRKIFFSLPAFLGALFYLYAPYHLYDLYKRGSVGEILALAVAPFIFWMIERKNLVFTSVGIALLILSHNTLAALFLPIILIYGVLRKLPATCYLLPATLLGLGLSAFFWIPAVYDLQFTRFFQTTVSDWQNYFVDSNLLGLSTILIFVSSVFFCYDDLNHRNRQTKLFLFFLAIGLGSLFCSLKVSAFIWTILPVSFIQFPFRLLSITILCGAFLTAFIVEKVEKSKIALVLILIVVIFFSAKSYLQPVKYFDKGEGFYTTNEGTTTVAGEYLSKWVKTVPLKRPEEKIEILKGQPRIEIIKNNNQSLIFNISSSDSSTVRIKTMYFPGWQLKIDGNQMPFSFENEEGVIDLFVKGGEHQVLAEFKETPIRIFADFLSVLSMIILLFLLIIPKIRHAEFITSVKSEQSELISASKPILNQVQDDGKQKR